MNTRLFLCSILAALAVPATAADKVLFIRGGAGTVGFLEGGSDEQGADIYNYATNGGNHGWGELNAALGAEGFELSQLSEDPVTSGVPTPVPLDTMDLDSFSIIVFGSNNAEYTTPQVDAFMTYINDGGAALFISDANFGQNWGDAPSSDQSFLSRFGLTMNQDQGTYFIRRTNEFLVPAHPIFQNVDNFDGEGVSPTSLSSSVSGVTSTILSSARNSVRRNTGAAQGPSEPVTVNDGSLIVATYGSGRIACHFDRNTFFNDNGAGSELDKINNEEYARNLFNWMAGKSTTTTNYAPRGHFPDIPQNSTFSEGSPITVDLIAKDPDGSISYVDLFADGLLVSRDTLAPYSWNVSGLLVGSHTLTATIVDDSAASTDASITVEVTDGADLEVSIPRGNWTLSATNNTAELGNAIDGNIASRWATMQYQTPGQTFGVDFGQREIFQRIVLETPNNPDDYPRSYILRGSDDGINFTTLLTGVGDGPTTEILLSPPVTYRHIQIEQTGTSSNRWWSIHEINIYHPPANQALPLASWLQFYYAGTPDALLVDGDHDGLTTLEEFAFGTDPTSAASRHQVTLSGTAISYRRWNVANGVTYTIEQTTDLENWSNEGFTTSMPVAPVSNRDGTETVREQLSFPVQTPSRFLRLKLDLAP